jgi:telomerase reverse transcriptase
LELSKATLLILQVIEEGAYPTIAEPVQSPEEPKVKTQLSNSTTSSLSIAGSTYKVPPRKKSMLEHSTPTAMVSAFCRAVLSRLLPSEFWGTGDSQAENKQAFNKNVDRFIELRRFESLSLHEVSQGLKVSFLPRKKSVSDLGRSQI